MGVSTEYKSYIREKFEVLGEVNFASFFGGMGVNFGGVQFAMVMSNVLYFCVDNESRQQYLDSSMEPFSYATKKGTIQVNKYYSVPEEVLENPNELREWAQRAIKAAHASSTKKSRK